MGRKLLTGAVVVGVAWGAAGCGGDDPEPRANFKQQANAICARFAKDSQTLISETLRRARGANNANAAIADVRDEIVAQRRREIDSLRELTPPDGVADAYEQMTESMEAGLELLPTAEEMRANRDPKGERRQAQESRLRQAARRAGLRNCT